MDKPSAAVAIVGAAVAGLVFGGAGILETSAAPDTAALPAVAASDAGCERDPAAKASASGRTAPARDTAKPAMAPPTGPPDRQMNPRGTQAAGGAGTVVANAPGDPCAPAGRGDSALPQ